MGKSWPLPGWAACITATPAAPPEWRPRRTRILRPAKGSGLSSDPLRGADAGLQSRDHQRALGHGLSRISAFIQHPAYGELPSVSRFWRTTSGDHIGDGASRLDSSRCGCDEELVDQVCHPSCPIMEKSHQGNDTGISPAF